MEQTPPTPALPAKTQNAPTRIFYSLVYLRKSNNVTQKELADALGVERSYLSLIENGKKPASPNMLQKIAAHFDVTVSDLQMDAATVEMAKQMIAEDVTHLYHKGEGMYNKADRTFLLQVIRTLTPQVLVEEKVTTQTDTHGNIVRERAVKKAAQLGVNINRPAIATD